ncbi:MAG: SCP2 sterol-binding domain-containing protein [Usitatibacter sp.]
MRQIVRWTALAAIAVASSAMAAPVLMSAEWAAEACRAWNADAGLTGALYESGWAANNKNRAQKILRMARADCKESPQVELQIAVLDRQAHCVAGVPASAPPLDLDVDYLMTAQTARWMEMGRGEYGPMRAMMFGKLSFEGPMIEAMGNMGPFEGFLRLVGKVPGDTASCPK